jgi:hypothetical protein
MTLFLYILENERSDCWRRKGSLRSEVYIHGGGRTARQHMPSRSGWFWHYKFDALDTHPCVVQPFLDAAHMMVMYNLCLNS